MQSILQLFWSFCLVWQQLVGRFVEKEYSFEFLIFIFSVVPLKCYVCDSFVTPDCEDPFKNNSVSLEECQTDEYQSMKEETVCLKFTIIDLLENRTSRTCYQQTEDCCEVFNVPNVKFCETCKTDGCNGSTQMKPFILFVIFSTLKSLRF